MRGFLARPHPWYTILPATAILAFVVTFLGYWQLIFAAGLLAGLLLKRPWIAFVVAAAAGALAWGVHLGYLAAYYPLQDASILLLEVLGLCGTCYVVVPYILAFLIAGIVPGLGALLGAYGHALTLPTMLREPPE